MSTAAPEEFAVKVTREDGTVCRIGPIPYQHVAQQMHRQFTFFSPGSRTGAAEATVEVTAYEAGEAHLPLLPCNADFLVGLLYDPVEGSEAPFPDLWDRLEAQHGHPRAAKAFSSACALYDYDHAEGADK